jgi:hypothetical protein
MRQRSRLLKKDDTEDELSLQNRLLTALLAPVFFNLSIFIFIGLISRRSRLMGKLLIYEGHLLIALLLLLPAIAGFMMGTSKFATLLGHFFGTNMEHERDLRITAALWIGLGLIAYLLSRLI